MKILRAFIKPFSMRLNPQKTSAIALTEKDVDRLRLMIEQVKNMRLETDLEILKIRMDTLK
jgi:hypothetical protein